jgi:hypothetical protein
MEVTSGIKQDLSDVIGDRQGCPVEANVLILNRDHRSTWKNIPRSNIFPTHHRNNLASKGYCILNIHCYIFGPFISSVSVDSTSYTLYKCFEEEIILIQTN